MKRVRLHTIEEIRSASIAIASYLVGGRAGRQPPDPIHEWVTEGRRTASERAIASGVKQVPYRSCGDLAHATLWCLGCRDEHLVNRDSDGGETPWVDGVNIERLYVSPAYQRATRGASPALGDILHVQSPDHVSVLLSQGAGVWMTADYGQPYAIERPRIATRTTDGRWCLGGRTLVGWIDLARVQLTEVAIVPDGFDGEVDDNPYDESVKIPAG